LPKKLSFSAVKLIKFDFCPLKLVHILGLQAKMIKARFWRSGFEQYSRAMVQEYHIDSFFHWTFTAQKLKCKQAPPAT
jgi:hypothetical protein